MSDFNLYSLPPILVTVFILILVYILVKNNPRRDLNITLAFVCFGGVLWLLSIAAIYILGSHDKFASLFSKTCYVGVTAIVVGYFHFTLSLLRLPSPRKKLTMMYSIGALFLLLNFSSNLIIDGTYKFYWGQYPKAGPLHPYYLVFALGGFVTCLLLLFNATLNRENRYTQLEQNRIKFVFWAFLLGNIASIDFIPSYGIEFYPLGCINVAIFVSIIVMAIVRHRLMDINIVIKKGLVYSILVAIITLAYIFFVFLAERFSQMVIGYRSLVINLLVIFTVAILFNPIRNKIQRFLDKRFFKGTLESLAEERNRLQQELFHKEKLAYVGQLASSVVHEIRNPLTALKAFAEYLPQKYDDPEFRQKLERLLPQEIARIEKVVLQLLDLAKPREVSFSPLSITQVIESTLLLLENNFRLKKINIFKDFCAEEIIIQGNEEQLRQVFLNLFLNSIQAMDEGGTLTVSASIRKNPRGEKSAVIRVQDTGSGISEDNLNKLFTPFFTTKKSGIGLGLSISRELIEEHNGKISVESNLGVGTKFTVELPLN